MSERKDHPINPSERIDQYIEAIPDWRATTLANVRKAILEADPEITEDWKWMGSPVWCHTGNVVVGNAHKDKVKLTFAQGASLPDPDGLFNAGFNGKVWRAIDIFEGNDVDPDALKALVRAAVSYNQAKKSASARAKAR